MAMGIDSKGPGSGSGPSGVVTVIEQVKLPCGHEIKPDWDHGDRLVTCPVDGRKATVRSHRLVVVSFEASPCSTAS